MGGCLLTAASLIAFTPENRPSGSENNPPADIEGAWEIDGNPKELALLVDGYFSVTVYHEDEPQFVSTMGGSFSHDGSAMSGNIEFNSEAPEQVGESFTVPATLEGDQLTVTYPDGQEKTWTRIDNADENLAGVWRITEREVDGEMNEMPLRARRTLKILTGGHFQWAAINVETGEFSGTGGGTYTFEDGQYTENIKFFSRDNSRVGMSLGFGGELKGDNWHHKGKSSKGDPIYEVWSRFEQ